MVGAYVARLTPSDDVESEIIPAAKETTEIGQKLKHGKSAESGLECGDVPLPTGE